MALSGQTDASEFVRPITPSLGGIADMAPKPEIRYDPTRTSACKALSVLPVAAVPQVPLVNQCATADPHEGAVAMKLFGNVFLIACLLLAGGWLWLTSTLHQQRGAAVWLTAGVIVFVGIACRYFFAAGDKA